ncbi:hypothetical protein ACHAQA_004069 [Verticillium albo-atrum]
MHSLPPSATALPHSNRTSTQVFADLTPDPSEAPQFQEDHEQARTGAGEVPSPDPDPDLDPDTDLDLDQGLYEDLDEDQYEDLYDDLDPDQDLDEDEDYAYDDPSLTASVQALSTQALSSSLAVPTGPPSDLTSQLGAFSTTHFTSLGPENHGLHEFLRLWTLSDRWGSSSTRGPWMDRTDAQMAARPSRMSYEELRGEEKDFQGLDWQDMGIPRRTARERRKLTYKNYTNKIDSDKWQGPPFDGYIPGTENFFKFRRMDIRRNVHLAHFQLRNVLACADRSHVFYPGRKVVHRINPISGHTDVAMDLDDIFNIQVSTLDAKHGMLVVGTFNGEYCMRPVNSMDTKFTEGQVTTNNSGITNHLQIHESRHSGGPLVAFASNDQGFRVMDINTEKFVLNTKFSFPMNCTALSPDRRLRVMVGDSNTVVISCADTGAPLQWLSGHRDHGFASAWSEDGWTVATAAQDKSVKIWDARRWTNSRGKATPVATIRSEMASVRSLRFSPLGSGPPVLVAAEEADFVNIINARTFQHKQTIDIFGEIGGIGFTDNGNDLNILCMDRHRGGLIQLERCSYGSKSDLGTSFQPSSMHDIWRRPYRSASNRNEDVHAGLHHGGPLGPRTRVYWDDMEPF